MILPITYKVKEKFIIIFTILLVSVSIIYIYLNNLQENNRMQWNGERCLSELTSIKYQLNVVTEYKNKIDKLLTDSQKAHESDKEKLKDIMESCIAMKQQSSICQNQFEDLQNECKKVKEDYDTISKQLEKSKVKSS